MSAIEDAEALRLVHHEALCLDERRWDDWIELYTDDAEFWAPAWKSEARPTESPDSELSLIYLRGKAALRERVWRMESGLSAASSPLRRTVHLVSNVLADGDTVTAAAAVHHYDPVRRDSHAFFSRYRFTVRREAGAWRIARKYVLLMNDQIPAVADIYLL